MGLSIQEAKRAVIDFCSEYPAAYQVQYKLRETQEEVFNEKAKIEDVGKIYGAYFPSRGIAGFAVANFRDKKDFEGTLKHEILGHFGINTCTGKEKHALLKSIVASKNELGINKLWGDITRDYPEHNDLLKAEEAFAFTCEKVKAVDSRQASRGEAIFDRCQAGVTTFDIQGLEDLTQYLAGQLKSRDRVLKIRPETDYQQFKKEEKIVKKKPFHETVAEKLIEEIKAGTAPWQRPWEPGYEQHGIPHNPTSGKRYRGINAIHLMCQGRKDSRWLTYNQGQKIGAQVRRGEKGTQVQYWKFNEEQVQRDENGNVVKDDKGKPKKIIVQLERPKLFTATVFNAEQLDGMPPLEDKKPVSWDVNQRAENILNASKATILNDQNDSAFYRLSSDSIHLPPKEQFSSPEKYYATALHELGHWSGHSERLDRDMQNPFGSKGYAKEELRAEISSMLLGSELGVGHDPSQHAAYVGSWVKVLEEDPMEIFRAAADAEKISGFILGLENIQEQEMQNDRKQEYNSIALDYLKANYSLNSLDEDHLKALEKSASEGDAPIVGAMKLSEEFSLKLNDDGFIHSVATNFPAHEGELKATSELRLSFQGAIEDSKAFKYSFDSSRSDLRHIVALDLTNNTSEVIQTFDKSNNEVAADPDAFIKDVLSLSNEVKRALRLNETIDQYTQIFEVDIATPLADESVSFSHFEAFVGGDTLEESLRSHGLATLGDVTGNDPYKLYDNAFVNLSPVFGIPEDYDESDSAYFERKGLAQHLSLQAEKVLGVDWNDLRRGVALMDAEQLAQEQEGEVRGNPEAKSLQQLRHELDLADQAVQEITSKPESSSPSDAIAAFEAQGIARKALMDAEQLAQEQESEVRDNPDATDAEKVAAKEERKSAEMAALLADKEAQEYAREMMQKEVDYLTEQRDLAVQTTQKLMSSPENSTPSEVIAAVEAQGVAERALFLAEQQLNPDSVSGVEINIPSEASADDLVNAALSHVSDQNKAVSKEKIFIDVPYKEKDAAKELGAKWDRAERSWFIPPGLDSSPFQKWQNQEQANSGQEKASNPPAQQPAEQEVKKTYLAVPFKDKDQAKKAGAKWDKGAKSWYADSSANMDVLKKWLPENTITEQTPSLTPREEFAQALTSMGCVVTGDHPIMDGKKHRIATNDDKSGQKTGFYVGYLDGHPAGYIKDNRTGDEMRWKSKGYALSSEDKAKLAAEAANKKEARELERSKEQQATSERLYKQLERLEPVEKLTPYLNTKGLSAHAGVFTDKENKTTFIPAHDKDGKIWTMQYINEDGTKRFAKDSRKEGCYHVVGGEDALSKAPAIFVGEGYATAATIAEVMECATVAAFDSGNLEVVAKELKEKYPDKPFVIIGDDDAHLVMTQGKNVGREKAEAAAEAISASAVFPTFTERERGWPAGVAKVTPESYRNKEISSEQKSALSRIKRFSDFNDMGEIGELGRAGIKRQLSAVLSLNEKRKLENKEEISLAQEQKQQQSESKSRSRRVG